MERDSYRQPRIPDPATDSERTVINHALGNVEQAIREARHTINGIRPSDDFARALDTLDNLAKALTRYAKAEGN
jgi:hypothetical protein